jgi:aspartyl-tRNA(Asn)/glutamyl-tRNA(Gln) amidotransferase subunit C
MVTLDMSNQITRQQAEKVAHLSRLDLSETELELFSGQLSAIVEYIQKLNELDTENVEPLAHCLPVHNVFRDDVVRPSLDVEKALENAPDRVDDYFKVPQILEDNSNA